MQVQTLSKKVRGNIAGVNKERRTRNADHPGKIPTPLSRCIPSGQCLSSVAQQLNNP